MLNIYKRAGWSLKSLTSLSSVVKYVLGVGAEGVGEAVSFQDCVMLCNYVMFKLRTKCVKPFLASQGLVPCLRTDGQYCNTRIN